MLPPSRQSCSGSGEKRVTNNKPHSPTLTAATAATAAAAAAGGSAKGHICCGRDIDSKNSWMNGDDKDMTMRISMMMIRMTMRMILRLRLTSMSISISILTFENGGV